MTNWQEHIANITDRLDALNARGYPQPELTLADLRSGLLQLAEIRANAVETLEVIDDNLKMVTDDKLRQDQLTLQRVTKDTIVRYDDIINKLIESIRTYDQR